MGAAKLMGAVATTARPRLPLSVPFKLNDPPKKGDERLDDWDDRFEAVPLSATCRMLKDYDVADTDVL